jgi:hypothetical protein
VELNEEEIKKHLHAEIKAYFVPYTLSGTRSGLTIDCGASEH